MEWTEQPECPHCEANMDLGEAYELGLKDDDSDVADCGTCGAQYRVTARVYTEWSTRPWTELDETRRELSRARAADLVRCLALTLESRGKPDEALMCALMANTIQYDDNTEQALERLKATTKKAVQS